MNKMEEHTQYNLKTFGKTNVNNNSSDFISTPNVARTDKDFIIKDFYILNNTEFINKKGLKVNRIATGINYSVTLIDYLVVVNSVATTITIGLPRPLLAGVGKSYIVKDEAGGASGTTITIVSAGEENIDGASSTTLSSNYASKSFYTDGANWFIY